MVLSHGRGATSCRAPARHADDGSQSLELALAVPFVVVALTLVVHAAVFGADLVTAQNIAFQAARTAAVDDDDAVHRAVRQAAGARPVEVSLTPSGSRRRAGDLVAATVRLRSTAFEALGVAAWAPGRATVRVERP